MIGDVFGWLSDPVHWEGTNFDPGILSQLGSHVWYCLVAVVSALAIGLPVGLWIGHSGRATWLVVNLVTAVLASLVIGLFDATIQQMVALAALMPMVASMGGNAGTQTMTVTVRALAMDELESFKVRRLIMREMLVGVLNGLIFALLMGLLTWFRFFNPGLGLVIGLAMIVNMIAAGSAGVAYRSVRHEGGQCVGLFRPRGASRCVHAAYLLYAWDGQQFADVYERVSP